MSSNPFEEWDDVVAADWTAQQEKAWNVFRKAEVGDEVVWGGRANPLLVNERNWTDGLIELEVEGPRGGTYTLRERYEMGEPKYYADDSTANDLMFPGDDRGGDGLSTNEYEELVVELETASLNTFSTGDFSTYRTAVRQVVDDWSADVQFAWRDGMDDESEALGVFKSIIRYSPQRPDTYDETRTPQWQAEQHLIDTIVERSEQDADLSLVRDKASYEEFLEGLASDAIDRLGTSRYESASLAARDAADDAIENHSDEFYRSVIEHSERKPMEYDYYADQDGEDQYEAMAFDVLSDDVRERVREIRRSKGSHDPRPAGVRWSQYDQVAEMLVEQAIREHRINDNRLVRQTVEDVVGNFSDKVDAGNFELDGQEFASRDAEDVFGSLVLHSPHEPSGFNPFSDDSTRESAFDVLVEDVTNRYKNSVDEARTEPVPADKYLSDELGFGFSYQDLREDNDLSTEDFIRETLQNYEGEWGGLTGWTFVDELVEVGGFNVPRVSSEWVLVDYGLVEEDNRLRRAAWFHREDGSVLGLTGITSQPPMEDGPYEFEEFGVYIMRYDQMEPEYLLTDVSIQEAMEFIYSRVGGDTADVTLIETNEGQYYVQDTFDRGELDSGTLLANLAPGLDVPGIGLVPESIRRRGGNAYERITAVAREKIDLSRDATRFAILVFMETVPYASRKALKGTEIRPTYHQKRGVGLEFMNTIGDNPDEKGVGGNFEGNLYIRPKTLGAIRDSTPVINQLWSYGDTDVDVSAVDATINDIIENVEDRTAEARAKYLRLFLPMRPRTAPQSKLKAVSKKYFAEKGEGYGENVFYTLLPGETLEEDEITERIKFARNNGIGKPQIDESVWGEEPYNLIDLQMLSSIDDDEKRMLPPAMAEEVGWSLTASSARELFGPEDGVERGNFAGSYTDFLDLYDEFSYVPEKSVSGQGFQWLIEEGRSSDAFTMVDAYDAFRTSLVFNKQAQQRDKVFAELIEDTSIDPEALFAGTPGSTADQYEQRGLSRGGVQFVWDFGRDSDFANVFDGKNLGDVEQILMAPGRGGYGASRYWVNEGKEGDYSLYDDRTGGERETDFEEDNPKKHVGPPELGPAQTVVVIDSGDKLWEWANTNAKEEVRKVLDKRELVEDDSEAQVEKWLDGTSLDIGGLFLSGMSAAAGLNGGSFMSSRDLFPMTLNDIPGVNFEPSRPDIPSFSEWRRSRQGLIGDNDEMESAQRGRYLREISDFINPNFRQLAGIDEEAEFESEADRQAAMADGDYEDYRNFYADEFGNSFDDVSGKFNQDGLDREQAGRAPGDLVAGEEDDSEE